MVAKIVAVFLFVVSTWLLIMFFLRNDRGTKEPRSGLLMAMLFGLIAIGIAAGIEYFLPKPQAGVTLSASSIFLTAIAIGFIEESAKFIPLALFIRKKPYFNEHTDGIIYFAIVGLTFGFVENLLYTFVYSNQLGGSAYTGIARLIILFFFHAASTGIVGYYLAKTKIHHQGISRVILALVSLALIHGIYDFLFLYSSYEFIVSGGFLTGLQAVVAIVSIVGGLIMSALLNTCLFLYFRRAKQWDASIGLATDPKLLSGAYAQNMPPVPGPQSPYPPSPM